MDLGSAGADAPTEWLRVPESHRVGQVDAYSFLANVAPGAPGHGLVIAFTNKLTGFVNRMELAGSSTASTR